MKRYALIWCTNEPGDDPLKQGFIETYRPRTGDWTVLPAGAPNFATAAAGFDGYVITGSIHSAVEDQDMPLVDNVLRLIRQVGAENRVPLVGICFGAQAIAVALGGEVGPNTDGCFRLGVDTVAWATGLALDQWPESLTRPIVFESHGEAVLALPPDGVALASSRNTVHEVFLVGCRILGIQGHPEIDEQFVRERLMPVHRHRFTDQEWPTVEREVAQEVDATPLADLARRLLADGTLGPPVTVSFASSGALATAGHDQLRRTS